MKGFLFLFATTSRSHPASYPMGTASLFSEVKLTTCLHLVPRLITRGAIPALPQYVFVTWCLVKHRYSFTFTFKEILFLSIVFSACLRMCSNNRKLEICCIYFNWIIRQVDGCLTCYRYWDEIVLQLSVTVKNIYGEGLLAPCPTPQAGGTPLVGCPRLPIKYIRSYPPYPDDFLPSATWGRAMPCAQKLVHSTCDYPVCISLALYLSNIILRSTPLYSEWTFPFRSSDQDFVCIPHLSYECYMPRPSHPPWFDHSHNRGFIQKFPDWVDNEIYAYLWYYSLRNNTKGCGCKTH
jgi:hypothetical protein